MMMVTVVVTLMVVLVVTDYNGVAGNGHMGMMVLTMVVMVLVLKIVRSHGDIADRVTKPVCCRDYVPIEEAARFYCSSFPNFLD